MPSFAEALKEWRDGTFDDSRLRQSKLNPGLTQKRVADLFGVSQRTIKGYESGEHLPMQAVRLNIQRVAPHLLSS